MDFLSNCPSLFDILLFMPMTDIRKCRRVNRRIRDVLLFNSKALDPTARIVSITHEKETDMLPQYAQITISTSKRKHHAFANDDMIVLLNCSRGSKCHYFGFDAVPCRKSECPWDIESMIITKLPLGHMFMERSECYNCYETTSIEEGLREIFSTLANKFSWRNMNMQLDIPDSWMNTLADVFQSNLTSCLHLEMQLSGGIGNFASQLGCSRLSLTSQSEAQLFMSELLDIVRWDRRIKIVLHRISPMSMQTFIDLLQSWHTGEWSLNNVSLEHTVPPNMPFSWTDEAIDLALSSVRHTCVVSDIQSKKIINNTRKISFKRNADSKQLNLTVTNTRLGYYPNTIYLNVSEESPNNYNNCTRFALS